MSVIFHETDGNKELDHRRDEDELFLVKVRDYRLPIPCFKHIPKSACERRGPFIHYYQARADGQITATYRAYQITDEIKLPKTIT